MATEATQIEVDGRAVRLTSPSKVMFPDLGLTKLDLANYVIAVGPGILGALKDRPTTMERWPSGYSPDVKLATRHDSRGDAFYNKTVPKGTPEWVQTAQVTFPSGRTTTEVAPADVATIVWMINLGTLRFHAWPSRLPDTDQVDQLRIDLDPQEGTTFAQAVEAAHEAKLILEEAKLTPFIKTSGGRGLHVFCPIQHSDFIDTRHAAIAIGRELARRQPKNVTVNWWKEERGQRIFVDFNQTARDRLMASAYSIRPVPDARVSMPITWDELDAVDPAAFTVTTAPQRFEEQGDAWAGWGKAKPGSLKTALEWYERDAANGEGEMPYPPEYPKMPGEPPRVQPSRAKKVAE